MIYFVIGADAYGAARTLAQAEDAFLAMAPAADDGEELDVRVFSVTHAAGIAYDVQASTGRIRFTMPPGVGLSLGVEPTERAALKAVRSAGAWGRR